ncbi:hypothetical protein BHE74_00011100 [Ensete ventricosum]|nr:hypothetical protein GW17_00000412 [Ensete ventricosum]RWW80552.1 hypothetical protein BHE74_00011100 [Ensete ventricosum]RZR86438.1 hypothetical protein BHM03_00013636 [Ensete ventricosum]
MRTSGGGGLKEISIAGAPKTALLLDLDELELSLQGLEEPVYAVLLVVGEGGREEARALRPRPWPPQPKLCLWVEATSVNRSK